MAKKRKALTAGEVFAEKIAACPEARRSLERVRERAQAIADVLSSEEFIANRESYEADWEKEFGEPFPNTIEELEAFQIRIKMGSGKTFSDRASGDGMWGIIEGYLKG